MLQGYDLQGDMIQDQLRFEGQICPRLNGTFWQQTKSEDTSRFWWRKPWVAGRLQSSCFWQFFTVSLWRKEVRVKSRVYLRYSNTVAKQHRWFSYLRQEINPSQAESSTNMKCRLIWNVPCSWPSARIYMLIYFLISHICGFFCSFVLLFFMANIAKNIL